jgi:hypothetical protein
MTTETNAVVTTVRLEYETPEGRERLLKSISTEGVSASMRGVGPNGYGYERILPTRIVPAGLAERLMMAWFAGDPNISETLNTLNEAADALEVGK